MADDPLQALSGQTVQALIGYVQHKSGCATYPTTLEGQYGSFTSAGQCDCGLSALLSLVERHQAQEEKNDEGDTRTGEMDVAQSTAVPRPITR